MTFASGDALPQQYRSGAFIGQHGSWNREPRSGYNVEFVPFANGKPIDVLTGFVCENDEAYAARLVWQWIVWMGFWSRTMSAT
jgi:glucose/arabinose dehydrogenase